MRCKSHIFSHSSIFLFHSHYSAIYPGSVTVGPFSCRIFFLLRDQWDRIFADVNLESVRRPPLNLSNISAKKVAPPERREWPKSLDDGKTVLIRMHERCMNDDRATCQSTSLAFNSLLGFLALGSFFPSFRPSVTVVRSCQTVCHWLRPWSRTRVTNQFLEEAWSHWEDPCGLGLVYRCLWWLLT